MRLRTALASRTANALRLILRSALCALAHRPRGEEAFEKARRERKPIFLSVGYSTCHWCHVMERESFESEAVAQLLNAHFVPVKVDREERPDVDRVYMARPGCGRACTHTQALMHPQAQAYIQGTQGGGGWPMSVWLTPELLPFLGGTCVARALCAAAQPALQPAQTAMRLRVVC